MNIIWSPLATEQTRDIATYIALDKPSVAVSWVNEVFESVERLKDFPQSGRVVSEIKRSDIREIVLGNYRVIYKVRQNDILVLIVKSYRQKLRPEEIIE